MQKLKYLLPLLLFLFLPILGNAQSSNRVVGTLTATCSNANTACTTAGSTVVTGTPNYDAVQVTVNGTYTGVTINFEVTDDGGTSWYSVACTRSDAPTTQETSEAVTNSATRSWYCPVAPSNGGNLRVRASARSSGTMNVGLTSARISAFNLFGGGGALTFQNAGVGIGTAPAFNCSTNTSCSITGGVLTITATNTAATAFSGITAATNSNAGTFTASGNTWVFSGATAFTLPTAGVIIPGSGSGTVTLIAQAAAGTPTVTFGTASGTPAVTASSPLAIVTATGNETCTTCVVASSPGVGLAHFAGSTQTVTSSLVALASDVSGQLPIGAVGSAGLSASSPLAIASTGAMTCTTCATTTNGGALSASAPLALSVAGAISVTGAAGQILAGATPAFTATPVLGTDNSVAGTLQLANGSAAFHTIIGTQATANWTFKFPTTAGTNLYVLQTDGSGNTSWVAQAGGGSGTVNSGTAGQLAYYAGSTTAVSGNTDANISSGALTLGIANSALGKLILEGGTSGALAITPQGIAGTPTWTAGTSSGTPVVTASSPLAITTATGNETCTTCVVASSPGAGIAHFAGSTQTVTSSAVALASDVSGQLPISAVGSSGLSASSPVTIASTGAIAITGAAGQVLAGASPAFTATPILGTDSSVAGTLQLANGSAAFHTIIKTQATANWTLNLPTTAGTNLYVLQTDGSGNTSWVAQSGGSSGISGLTSGYIPLAGSSTTITGDAHIDDGVTTAATLTATEPFVVNTGAGSSVVTLGASGNAGTIVEYPASGNFTTTWGSAATASNTILGFTTVPSNGHVITCTVVSTTCTLTDGGAAGSGTVTSIATTSPITGGTITTTGTIACGTCVTSAASLTSTALMTGGGSQASQTPSATATLNSFGNMSLPGTLVVTGHDTFEGVTSTGATGTGNLVFGTSPTFITPVLGTPASGTLTNTTGYLWSALANPTGNLALTMGSDTSIFNTTTAEAQMFAWKNTTAAVVGTSQGSPIPAFCGRAFHGGADVEDCTTISELPGNGNDAAITATIGHTGTSTGTFTVNAANYNATTSLSTGTAPSCAAGTSGAWCATEGTGVTGASAVDDWYADSTNHCWHDLSNNVDLGCVVAQPAGLVSDQTISGADYTNTSVTPSTVFSWTLPATVAAKNYKYTCDIVWASTSTTLVGPVFGINISAAPTQTTAAAAVQNTLAGADINGYLSNTTTGSQTLVTSSAAGVTSTNYRAKIRGTIEAAPTAGSTFIINAASTSGTTAILDIGRGSGCKMEVIQ